jgi:mannose/fructose-specific phosphotransferase system component IIA
MSEARPLRAVLLGHGTMPDGLVDAVRHITGCEPETIVPVSNTAMSPEALAARVLQAAGDGTVILFTDLQSGSCGFVARRLAQAQRQMVVISGVNLPMLIEFVMNRRLPLEELVPRLLSRGRAAIGCSPAGLEDDERRALSGR